MRRLVLIALAALALMPACKRRDRLVVETTEGNNQGLASVIHVADPRMASQLTSGFYDVEQSSWRWTKSKFVVTLRPPAGAAQKGARLEMNFNLPEPVAAKVGAVTLSASVAGTSLAPETFSKSGESTYSRDVPGTALGANAVQVQFSLDKFLPPGTTDQRELGVIVTTVGLEPK